MNTKDILASEIMEELKQHGIDSIMAEEWGFPFYPNSNVCITCKHNIRLRIDKENICVSWKVRDKWLTESYSITNPDSIDKIVARFIRSYKVLDIIKKRDLGLI